jgi:hypothetical protein
MAGHVIPRSCLANGTTTVHVCGPIMYNYDRLDIILSGPTPFLDGLCGATSAYILLLVRRASEMQGITVPSRIFAL